MIYISLIQNIGLLIALAFLHSLLVRRFTEKGIAASLLSGLLFGCVSIIVMMTPVKLQPGLIFDGRSIILSVSGLFGGPLAAVVAACISGAYRISLGGIGVSMGVGVIIESAGLGVLWHQLRRRNSWAVSFPGLLLFGLLVHLLMIGCMPLLPGLTAQEVFDRVALPVLLIFPPATLLVCRLFQMMELHVQSQVEISRHNIEMERILNNTPAIIYMKDQAGRYLFVNSQWVDLFHVTNENARGKTDSEIFPEDVARLVMANDLQVLQDGQTLEVEEQAPVGQNPRSYHSIKVALKDQGNIYALCSISTDITDRKQAEEALKGSEARLQLYFQRLPIACIVWGRDYRVLSWNPAAERLFGYQADEAVGRTANELMVPEDVRPSVEVVWQKLLEGNLDAHSVNENSTKDGRRILCSWTNTPYHDNHGKICGVISVIEDITERKQLESQLLQSQKLESIGRLAGGVAHDFNNMLSVIVGYAHLAMMELPEEEPHAQYLQGICEAAKRSMGITRQLLAFSRKEIVSPKPVDLNELIIETEKTSRRLIGEDISFNFRPAADLWMVNIDPSQMDQILMNLFVNARDAMPDGGNLIIETANVRFDEAYCSCHLDTKPGDYVELTVSDSGVGMDKEIIHHIFEPFFTTKGVSRGTGLGLATVYGIVTQNHGQICVSSEPGGGSMFKLHFPRMLNEPVTIKTTPPFCAKGVETILLVEDDLMVRSMTKATLEHAGYTVIPAGTPQSAVEICEQPDLQIDMVLTDVIMPEMNGREMIGRIKSIRPEVRVLFMSGYAADIVAKRGMLEEGFSFIQKPFTVASLNEKILQTMSDAAPG